MTRDEPARLAGVIRFRQHAIDQSGRSLAQSNQLERRRPQFDGIRLRFELPAAAGSFGVIAQVCRPTSCRSRDEYPDGLLVVVVVVVVDGPARVASESAAAALSNMAGRRPIGNYGWAARTFSISRPKRAALGRRRRHERAD
jgi:hypothetical protein